MPEKVKLKVDRLEVKDAGEGTLDEIMTSISALIDADLDPDKPGNPDKEYRVELRRFSKRC